MNNKEQPIYNGEVIYLTHVLYKTKRLYKAFLLYISCLFYKIPIIYKEYLKVSYNSYLGGLCWCHGLLLVALWTISGNLTAISDYEIWGFWTWNWLILIAIKKMLWLLKTQKKRMGDDAGGIFGRGNYMDPGSMSVSLRMGLSSWWDLCSLIIMVFSNKWNVKVILLK